MSDLLDPAYSRQILRSASTDFEGAALELFRAQYAANELYAAYVRALGVYPARVLAPAQIPFLPVSFFKTHSVRTGNRQDTELVFESSGTTGETPARHEVPDASLYRESLLDGFRKFWGAPEEYTILALLPSYLERGNASLVYMADMLIRQSGKKESGFYLDDFRSLHRTLVDLESAGRKTLLLGVTFALLDFAEQFPLKLQHTLVMETGGMKGRRLEWTRSQVHEYLKGQFGLREVSSEYGMTELLSQAYAPSRGRFECSDTMRVWIRDINDPFDIRKEGQGCINIIDLANIHSCAFLATDDIGLIHPGGAFEVLGRLDHAALRGCSLMTL